MSKHTPGPWTVDDNYLCAKVKDETIYLAKIHSWSKDAPEEGKANARLIAAAPELLESLEWWQKLGNEGASSDEWDSCQRMMDAVIAKARGEA